MNKLYVFGIGGTGSRVLRSLTMLLASGVSCGVKTIVPIIIDRDKGNGDFTRTSNLIKNYISVNKIAPKNDTEKGYKNLFFNTEIKLLGDELLLKLDDETNKFQDFIGITTQTNENKALSQILFSKNTLTMDTEYGFKGNPNIGCVVLNQFEDKNIFKLFASDFEEGDKIFIISSIFGGTGASGFPLLRKTLQTSNLKDATGAELQKWGLVNAAPIGAISVLPYFNVDKKENIDSDTFNDKTRAALSYYETENGKLDTLYYIADNNRKSYKYAEGGKEQVNDAHFVELSSALAILDFVNEDKKIINFQKDNNGQRRTIYKEFGINSDVNEVSFDNLAAETQKLIVNPLTRFMLFAKYMGQTVVKKTENGSDKFVVEKDTRFDIFNKENKYQPYAHNQFDRTFRNKITDLETVQNLFLGWLQEMNQQSRKFSPFNLQTYDAFDFVNGKISYLTKSNSPYKNWAKVDNEINRQFLKTNRSLNNESKFIELFYRTTEALINQTTQNNADGKVKYIFRLQTDGDFGLVNTIAHWDVSDIYGKKQQMSINSSNVHSENQPTSIPSPFARIALVKTAFTEVAQHGTNALASYQKIVSDTLDVAEIFFTLNKWKDKVEIITWKYGRRQNSQDFETDSGLKQLQSGHRILYKTLKTFLENDSIIYNFNNMRSLYILKYRKTGDMIGATSPCTLFFSSANDLSGIDIELNSQRKAFEGIFPLYKRDWNFQKYLYSWTAENNINRNVNGKDISIFEDFIKYLEAQKPLINRTEEIDRLVSIDQTSYTRLASPNVEVLDKPIFQSIGIDPGILNSDDILESKIVRINYPVSVESFFDGNLPSDCGFTYLLPIKDTFFNYFTILDLKNGINIEHYSNYVVVNLNIRGKSYRKEFKQSDNNIIDLPDIDCMLFPNAKFERNEDAYYRFGLFLPYSQKSNAEKYTVSFYVGNQRVNSESQVTRNTFDNENSICKTFAITRQRFDRIRISFEGASGLLLPLFRENGNAETFTFAVDFGTTNTHIEYKTSSNQTIRPIDILEDDKQISFLTVKNEPHEVVADIDFIPTLIGETTKFKYPVRSALSLQKDRESIMRVLPFTQTNIIIPYEKRKVPKYNKVLTQLKWDSTEDEMGYFIDSLCFMLRNKVVLNRGRLNETKIVWFYPLSMAGTRSITIRDKWTLAYAKYFLGLDISSSEQIDETQKDILKKNIIELPESIAPVLFYKDDIRYKDAINNLVSIDIGGGTTDIIFLNNGKDIANVTSFRFAANSIFGLGENITAVVSKYQSTFENIILDHDKGVIKYNFLFNDIYNGIKGDAQKGDIASFFFALKNHEKLQDVEIDYNSMLKKDSDQKLIFVLFYSAIIYHIAQIMKAKDLGMPRHIAFSGNGSRIVSILSDKEVIAELSKCIFEKVFGELYGNKSLEIIQNTKNPKEVTCKGGIKAAERDYVQNSFNSLILIGIDNATFVNDNDKYSSIDIDNSVAKTKNQVKDFIKFVLDDLLQQKYTKGVIAETFVKALNINQVTLQIARDVAAKEEDLINFTRNGINSKIASIGNITETQIEETFFFYPIASLLNVISNEINKKG